jgi:tRNA G10  N-methylase Trm11
MSQSLDFAVAVGDKFDFLNPLTAATSIRQRWLGDRGIYFLFNKNLRVTNVQFTELLSLLRMHTRECEKKERARALFFITSEEFDKLIVEIAEPFEGKADIGRVLATLYSEVFARTLIVDPYYGSCNVFVPPTLSVNLAAIAGESAYLHSCGYSVFVRNMVKAEPTLLRNKLNQHLNRLPPAKGKKLRFLIYSDEDFTARDRRNESLLRHGLDDTKIHVEKAWFRSQRLVDVVNQLKKDMGDRLVFGGGRDYLGDRETHRDDKTVDFTRTLWLVQDRSVGTPSERPGDDRYYICYDQLFRARNAIHIFDENKPAWQDHTTMPPSLAGALLNIVRGPDSAGKSLKVGDPFMGTGTSLLEVLRFPDMSFRGSDTDETSAILVKDNLDFFWRSKKELGAVFALLVRTKSELEQAKRSKKSQGFKSTVVYRVARETLGSGNLARKARAAESLKLGKDKLPADPGDRLLAYIALRASKRYSARFARAATQNEQDWVLAYEQELQTLLSQVEELTKLRALDPLKEDAAQNLIETHEHASTGSASVMLLEDSYSTGCIPGPQTEKASHAKAEDRYELVVGKKGDARKLPEAAFNVIIGDPPYGFNKPKDANDLAELYRQFARSSLTALRDGGHLLLCLPDRSHSGRYSPAFTHRSLVVQQLLLAAGAVDRQLVFPHDRVRGAEDLYDADYYWESERALRRSILHVQVRHAANTVSRRKITTPADQTQ